MVYFQVRSTNCTVFKAQTESLLFEQPGTGESVVGALI